MTISSTPPATTARWANVGGAITEPTEAKKNVGWVAEKPAHQAFNWWQNLAYNWLVYLNLATSEVDATKVEKSGDTMTGDLQLSNVDLKPTTTGQGKVGLLSRRFAEGHFVSMEVSGVASVATLTATTEVRSNTIVAPATSGATFGDATHRYSVFVADLNMSGEMTGNLVPVASGQDLGSAAKRWDAFLAVVNASGTLDVAGVATFTEDVNITGGKKLTAGEGKIGQFVNPGLDEVAFGSTGVGNGVRVTFINTNDGVECAKFLQSDDDSAFVAFSGTSGSGKSIQPDGGAFTGDNIRVEVNGVVKYLRAYDAPG